MQVRGAPLIGVAAAHGMALATLADPTDLDTPAATLAADAADRRQPGVGPRPSRRRARTGRHRRPRRRRARSRQPDGRPGRRRLPSHRRARCHPIRRDPRAHRPSRAGAHPLQRRPARLRRVGHRDRARLRGARARASRSTLGARDPAPQPGRALTAWELGDAGVSHTARRRQRRRAPARVPARSTSSSSVPTASPPTATSPTRSAPPSRRSPPPSGTSRSSSTRPAPPSTPTARPATTSRSRSATPARC